MEQSDLGRIDGAMGAASMSDSCAGKVMILHAAAETGFERGCGRICFGGGGGSYPPPPPKTKLV